MTCVDKEEQAACNVLSQAVRPHFRKNSYLRSVTHLRHCSMPSDPCAILAHDISHFPFGGVIFCIRQFLSGEAVLSGSRAGKGPRLWNRLRLNSVSCSSSGIVRADARCVYMHSSVDSNVSWPFYFLLWIVMLQRAGGRSNSGKQTGIQSCCR